MSHYEKKPAPDVEKKAEHEEEEIKYAIMKNPKVPCGRIEDQFSK